MYKLEELAELITKKQEEQNKKKIKTNKKNRLTHKNMYQPIILIHSKIQLHRRNGKTEVH